MANDTISNVNKRIKVIIMLYTKDIPYQISVTSPTLMRTHLKEQRSPLTTRTFPK